MYELRIYPDTLGVKAPETTVVFNESLIAFEAAFDTAIVAGA
jgi:hypothetical protein